MIWGEKMSSGRIVFVHRGGEHLASYRYRTELPAKAVGAQINDGQGEIIVFSKPLKGDLETAKMCKEQLGCKIVLDVCDPRMKHGDYAGIVELADYLVYPTEACREMLDADKPYSIIGDAYEYERVDPHVSGEETVWFGHRVNMEDLRAHVDFLTNLTVVTGPMNGPLANAKNIPGFVEWSVENLRDTLLKTDIAVFPARKGNEYKSANRVINAIQLGNFAVCDGRIPSYKEFEDFAWVGNFRTGVNWAKHHLDELNDLVLAGQEYIEQHYSPEAIGQKWKDLFDSI